MSTLTKNLTFITCTSDVLHPSRAYMLNELGPPRWAYLYIEYIKERLAAKHAWKWGYTYSGYMDLIKSNYLRFYNQIKWMCK